MSADDRNAKPGSSGRDNPKGWTHGGNETLRDPRGGTYGTVPAGNGVPSDATEVLPEGLKRTATAPDHAPRQPAKNAEE